MNKPHALALERRQAAAAIKWPEKTPFLLNPDPAARRTLKKLGLLLGALVVVWMIGSDPRGPLQEWATSVENRQMRPVMESVMKSGNRTAGTWLATHYWKEYPGLLQMEASAEEPTAMFIMGRTLMQDAHPERYFTIDKSLTAAQIQAKGFDLVRKAAVAGNQDALLYSIKHGGM
ncbi:hypothetical protein [Ralstonia pseudosolanacearum]|uniref:hypothetical protein n=1 Tax=Ralstonia pseudosolanacearum TaxID=1310165 RepID=UPI001FF875ED|nr:hypothetical protein [Ralstonia pseudosolanacearum]